MATTPKLCISQYFTLVPIPKPSTQNSFMVKFPKTSQMSHHGNDEVYERCKERLMEVGRVLRAVREDPLEGLLMIDALQRLGIDYHFREEIQDVLKFQYSNSDNSFHGNCPYEVSTRFRLLRQEGYNVPTDVFDTFKNKKGRFKSELSADIRGLMGLYEASLLGIEGEDILDEASEFSSKHLQVWMAHLDHHEAKVVHNTLKDPYHKSLARFMAKNILSDYKGPNGWINVLQELANLDFIIVRSTYRKEISQVSKWWEERGLAKELEFARDQPLKWYVWSLAILSDPSLSEQRVQITKPISLVYIIDDIFDVYGTLEELTLFTEVVNRWELDAVEQLPNCMKICFKALQDITVEIASDVYKKHGWNPTDSLRSTWARLCSAFLIEAQWFASGEMPNAEEYLKNGIISTGMHVVLVHIFFLLGQNINKETVSYVEGDPAIITSTATILRLWDDLGSAKDENQDGNDGSYVECYMKDHKGSSDESARKHVTHLISEAWKCLNRECLSPNRFSPAFVEACLNSARMVPLMYNYDDDDLNLPILKEYMESILLDDSVPSEGSKQIIHF